MSADAYEIPGPWPGRLAILARPRGGDWLEDDVREWRRKGIDVVVSLLTPEEERELALQDEAEHSRGEGLQFHSIPVPDRGVPASRAAFAELVHSLEQDLESGKNVAIHCRQGIGRSALVAAALMVTAGETPEASLRVIEQARGVPVPETREQNAWIRRFAQDLAPVR